MRFVTTTGNETRSLLAAIAAVLGNEYTLMEISQSLNIYAEM